MARHFAGGKLVVAGGSNVDGRLDATLVRYTTSGSPDPSFGSGGVVVTDTSGGELVAVTVQPDGMRILAVGGDRV